ncbi:unnamed protein product [Strongylus vulgaris]|uniref:glucuronosyltransferase n=1 Tax=Strongylus vulgaris TaxID=40348 RepID=A0A3P7JGP1_STRVU|nr:unnamed protein product [Strongylus vulgaris]
MLTDKLPTNVHIFKWLPQSDLLQNPKTKAFISHGGYTIFAGVLLITIPFFGDQPRNARLAERHHLAIRIHKNEVSVDTVADALNRVLTDESYSKNIKRLSRMVRKKPVSVSQLLVSWANFIAEFKTLDNLVPAGNKLNFIQYYFLTLSNLMEEASEFDHVVDLSRLQFGTILYMPYITQLPTVYYRCVYQYIVLLFSKKKT